jgi:hypothetical protein
MGLEMFDKNIVCLQWQADDKSSVPVLLHFQLAHQASSVIVVRSVQFRISDDRNAFGHFRSL